MLIFSPQNLAFLAVPKTGTTAVEMALKPRADVIFTKRRKHLTATKYRNKVLPFLDDVMDVRPQAIAVMRDPVEQIRSWFRYRSGPRQSGGRNSTHGCSFDDFVLEVISDKPAPFASIGSQFNFLCNEAGDLLVEHLFSYETQPALIAFLSEAFEEEISFKTRNVSPPVDAPLSAEVETQLRAARAGEFALYARLMDAGGQLTTSL
jgi:hypothetical protein